MYPLAPFCLVRGDAFALKKSNIRLRVGFRVTLTSVRHRGQDKSLKGSLDAPIVELVGASRTPFEFLGKGANEAGIDKELVFPFVQVNYLNGLPDYVTTSSCSGRIALFQDVGSSVCKKVRLE